MFGEKEGGLPSGPHLLLPFSLSAQPLALPILPSPRLARAGHALSASLCWAGRLLAAHPHPTPLELLGTDSSCSPAVSLVLAQQGPVLLAWWVG